MNIKEFKQNRNKDITIDIYNLDNKSLYKGFANGIPSDLDYIEIGEYKLINESTIKIIINQK